MNRIPTLDGWRGIAVLLVLVGHFSGRVNTGELGWLTLIGLHGVAIFFVLSGFLITTILQREFEATGRVDLRRFYLRRFFRLMPCAWCYLLAILGPPGLLMRTIVPGRDLLSCVFFWRNYYHDSAFADAFTSHFWSLAIEEQFYLV